MKNSLKLIKNKERFCFINQNLKINLSFFITGKFVDKGFLLGFNFL